MRNGKPYILVLDDSTSFHKMIEVYIRNIHVKVDIHVDFRNVEKDRLAQYDIALIDINLGDDDGVSAGQYLTEIGLSCPKIAMSGYHHELEQVNIFKHFFQKPPAKPYLLKLLENYIKIESGSSECRSCTHAHNMNEEIVSGVQTLEKGIASQSCEDIQRACHIFCENALLNKIPSFTNTVKSVQSDAMHGTINVTKSTDLLHFIKAMMQIQQQPEHTQRSTKAPLQIT